MLFQPYWTPVDNPSLEDLCISSYNRKVIANFIKEDSISDELVFPPRNILIITGDEGMGKVRLARAIAADMDLIPFIFDNPFVKDTILDQIINIVQKAEEQKRRIVVILDDAHGWIEHLPYLLSKVEYPQFVFICASGSYATLPNYTRISCLREQIVGTGWFKQRIEGFDPTIKFSPDFLLPNYSFAQLSREIRHVINDSTIDNKSISEIINAMEEHDGYSYYGDGDANSAIEI